MIKQALLLFTLQKSGHTLVWVGISHSRDDKNPQFSKLKNKWNAFVKSAHTPLVVLEYLDPRVHSSPGEAINTGGEAAFMTLLAKQANMEVVCFEPDLHLEMNYLAGLFGREKVEYYYFARVVAQWHRVIKNGGIEEYIGPFLRRNRQASEWDDFDFSVANMARIHKNLFGGKLDLNDKKFFLKIENPTREDNPLKAVVRRSTTFRDHMVIENVKRMLKGRDVFMVYGHGHRESHERRLRGE